VLDPGVPGNDRCGFVGDVAYGEFVYEGGLGDKRCLFAGGGPGSAIELVDVAEAGDWTPG
jgi:hypothetical protein